MRPIAKHTLGRSFRSTLILALLPALSQAGGYVDISGGTLNPATSIPVAGASPILPTFNNAVFTDQVVVSQVSNDPIRTPSTADPVSTVNGNNYHDETDLVIKGRGGLNYVFTRTYNSAPAATGVAGPLGYGWTHSYAMRLKSNDFGDCPNCPAGTGAGQRPENGNNLTASLTYVDERGGEHLYQVNEATQAVTAPMGEFDTLAFDTPASGQHTLTFRNGVKYVFETVGAGTLKTTPDVAARLKSIEDPYGNVLTLAYDGNGRLASVTDNLNLPGRTGLAFVYDANGRLDKITDWTGRVWDYTVSAGGELTAYANPLAQTTTYTYHPGHLLHEVILPELRNGQPSKTAFSYYRNGKTFQQTNSFDVGDTLDYDLYRKSTRVTDPRGGIRLYAYSGDTGALEKLTEPDGAILLFESTAEGLRNKKYDALGYATTYSYRQDRAFAGVTDAGGNVTREEDALGQTVDTDYGLYDQVTRVKDKRGFETFHDYYATTAGEGIKGRLQRTRIGRLTVDGVVYTNLTLAEYTYWPDGNLKRQTEYLDPADASKTRITDHAWQDNGLNLQGATVSGGGLSLTTEYTWDNLGRKTSETRWRRASPTDPSLLTLTTTFDYDALDRVTQVTDPDGHRVRTVYDGNGRVKEVWEHRKQSDASYLSRRQALKEYDAAERLIRETDVLGHATQYQYDEAGNLIQLTDPEGRTARFEYDAMNRKVAAIDAHGRKTRTAHDLAGRPIETTDPLGHATRTEYDALGRPVKITDPLGFVTEMGYDPEGRLTCLIDANAQAGQQPKNAQGCTLHKAYDELGRLIKETDALDGETRYVHDLLGNVVKLTDPEAHAWTFQHDGLGRQTGETDPLGQSEAWQVDEAGNVWRKTDRRGQVSTFTFDRLNRPTQASYAGGLTETYTFDAIGDPVAAADNQGVTYSFAFDDKHRLLSKTDQRLNKTLAFQYDAAGRMKSKTDYQADTTQYQFDAAGQLVFEQNSAYLQVSYHYDNAGRLLDRILSNGAQTRYGWDNGGRLTDLQNTGATGAMVAEASYTRDRSGRILSKTEGGQTTAYTYDPLYRLTNIDAPGTADDESYTYDKVGNRTAHTRNGVTKAYAYDSANRLKAIYQDTLAGAMLAAYVWDKNGSLTQQCQGGTVTRSDTDCTGTTAKTYGWDGKNRLAWTNVPGKTPNTYQYDIRDYRVQKTDSQGNRIYLLEGEHLEAVYSGSTLEAKYLRGAVIDEVVNGYQFDANGKWTNATYHHDALQSVVGLSGHNGDVLNLATYGPFGETQAESGNVGNFLMFTGREKDPDTGLYQVRARMLDPEIGRFISRDPIGFAGGINQYVYCGADPLNCRDPSGLAPGLGATRNFLKQSAEYLGLKASIEAARRRGINAAWKMEQNLVKNDFRGTVRWTPAQRSELLTTGKVSGFSPHHINNVADYPHMAGNPDNIKFVDNHLAEHGGSFQNSTSGALIDRTAGGQLPRIRDASGYSIKGAALGVGAAILSGAADAAEALEMIDPWTYLLGIGDAGGAGDMGPQPNTGGVSWQEVYDDGSAIGGAAGGGFLLYPNKSNTNMMRSVYSK